MKTYVIAIKPLSGFATPLKGDTLFGQLCWQAAYDPGLFDASLDTLLSDYLTDPFLVVSSAYPKKQSDGEDEYALKRPHLPRRSSLSLGGRTRKNSCSKEATQVCEVGSGGKRHKLEPLGGLQLLGSLALLDVLAEPPAGSPPEKATRRRTKAVVAEFSQLHNTINRLTNTTGEGGFAPYSVEQHTYFPGAELAIFVGARQKIEAEQIARALDAWVNWDSERMRRRDSEDSQSEESRRSISG